MRDFVALVPPHIISLVIAFGLLVSDVIPNEHAIALYIIIWGPLALLWLHALDSFYH